MSIARKLIPSDSAEVFPFVFKITTTTANTVFTVPLVDFGLFNYSFMLEFNLLRPQQEKSYSIRNAFDLGQTQGFSSKFI